MLSNFGAILMGLVDTAMVGRLGPAQLGGASIGGGIFLAVAVLGMGTILGMDALVSQAVGAGEMRRARTILWQAIRLAVAIGIPLTCLALLFPWLLPWAGVDLATAGETKRYLYGRAPSIMFFCLYWAARTYLQAHDRTRALIWAIVLGNVVNLVGNGLLIFGDQALTWAGLPAIGLPAMGVLGAGASSTLAHLAMLVPVALAAKGLGGSTTVADRAYDADIAHRIVQLGVPIGLQQFVETAVFTLTAVAMARIGQLAVAGHQVAITIASFTFMGAVGLQQATAVRVGHYVGQNHTPNARRAGFIGIAVGLAYMLVSAAVFLLFPEALARLMTDEAPILAAAVPLLQVAAAFQLFDGLQAVAAGALRGGGDTKTPLWGNLAGHYVIGLPLGIYLGFSTDLGPVGLWWGLCAGLAATGAVLCWKFHTLSLAHIERS